MAPIQKAPAKSAGPSLDVLFSYQIAGDMLNFLPTAEEKINRLGAMGTQYLQTNRPNLAIPFFEAQAGVRIQQIIDKPVHVWDKVQELSSWKMHFTSLNLDGVAQLYDDAETGQRIYGIIHSPGALSLAAHVSELADAINGPFSHRLSERAATLYRASPYVVANAIVYDKQLSVRQKIDLLEALEEKTSSPVYRHARAEQSARLSKKSGQPSSSTPKKTEARSQDTALSAASGAQKARAPVSIQSLGFSPDSLATHSGVSSYAAKTLKMAPEKVLSILQTHFKDICTDFAKIESDRNGMWGPGPSVLPQYVATQLARFYLNEEARRIPAKMIEVIVSKESNSNKDLISNQDLGLFQINKGSIDDMCQIDSKTHKQTRMNDVNNQMKKWGLKPFDIHLGQYYETSRKKGRGWKKLEFDPSPESRYYQKLCSPDAVEMASWVIVRKMLDNHIYCRPDQMSEQQMRTVFGAYNSATSGASYGSDAMERLKWVKGP